MGDHRECANNDTKQKREENDMKRLWMVLVLTLALIMSGMALAETVDSNKDSIEIALPDDQSAVPPSQDLSDLTLGQTYTLPGYARIKTMSFTYVDSLAQYNEDADLALKEWIAFDRNSAGYINVRLGSIKNDESKTQMHNFVLLIGGETELEPKDWSDTGISRYLEQNNGFKFTKFIPNCGWMESGINSDFACLDFQIVNMQSEAIDLAKSAQVIVNYDGAQYRGWIRQVNQDIGQVYRYYVNVYTPHYAYAAIAPSNAAPIMTGQVATYVVGATLPNLAIEETDTPLSITVVINDNELTYHIR